MTAINDQPSVGGSASLKLEQAEADVLGTEARSFARALSDVATRARFEQLAAAASLGTVPAALVPSLETMLELVFEKGRPSNRAVLQTIFARTPRGHQQVASVREVNTALRSLRGARLDDARQSSGPSRHTLVLETDRCTVTLELDAAGARVASLEMG